MAGSASDVNDAAVTGRHGAEGDCCAGGRTARPSAAGRAPSRPRTRRAPPTARGRSPRAGRRAAGSTPAILATSARNPCQSGKAYPGWSPPSGNSSTRCSERSPSDTELAHAREMEEPVARRSARDVPEQHPEHAPGERDDGPAGVAAARGRFCRPQRPGGDPRGQKRARA